MESNPITEQLAEFNKILDDSVNIDVNVEDEDETCCCYAHYQSFLGSCSKTLQC